MDPPFFVCTMLNPVYAMSNRSAFITLVRAATKSGTNELRLGIVLGIVLGTGDGAHLPGIEAGFFFSVPPSIERAAQKQKLVRRLPLENLLIETDSPVLGPDPKERNEPANARISLRAIAELKELPIEAVEEAIEENTRRLYGDLL